MTNNLEDLRERMLELADEGMRAPVRAPTATPPDSHGAVVLRAAAVIVALAALGAAAWSVAGDQGRGRTLPAVTAPMTSLATPALPDATVPVVDSTASPVDEPAVTEPPAAENTSVGLRGMHITNVPERIGRRPYVLRGWISTLSMYPFGGKVDLARNGS